MSPNKWNKKDEIKKRSVDLISWCVLFERSTLFSEMTLFTKIEMHNEWKR